jgi:hypothetical protein
MPISFYALITPLGRGSGAGGGERPDQGLPEVPVFPAHPIVIPPDAIGPGVPSHPIYIPIYPDQGLPGSQPGIDNSLPIVIPPDAIAPGVPTHPIYLPIGPDQGLPGQQPGIDNSLPGQQPKPDQGLPGQQPKPDQGLPGAQPKPDQGLPGAQPGIDNSLPKPIVLPPLPDVPDDAVGVVLVKMRNVEAEWMYITEDDELKPIDGEIDQSGGGKKSRRGK